MRLLRVLLAFFCFAFVPLALIGSLVQAQPQPQPQPLQDLNLLIGKRVVVQRVALCQPGTFSTVLAYAGKEAKVVSLKPFKFPVALTQSTLEKVPPEMRTLIEDERNAATILVVFDDGVQLDSCAPVSPSRLSDYFELAAGETLPPPSASFTPASPSVQTSIKSLTESINVLSDDEVKSAMNGKGHEHRVTIQDMGLMAAQGNQVPEISLYMPEAILAIRSESAKKQFIQYAPSEEDRRRSLTIVAQGYAGKTITEGCTSITRVVLTSDSSGGIVAEAYLSEPLDEVWRNNFGATNNCQALRAKFSLESVQRVRAAAPNGEFLVGVFSGTTKTKMYKVKRKHQSKLGLD